MLPVITKLLISHYNIHSKVYKENNCYFHSAVDKTKYDSLQKRLSMDPTAKVSLSKLEWVRKRFESHHNFFLKFDDASGKPAWLLIRYL